MLVLAERMKFFSLPPSPAQAESSSPCPPDLGGPWRCRAAFCRVLALLPLPGAAGARSTHARTRAHTHTRLGTERALVNEKQQMGVAGKCWLSAWGCRGGCVCVCLMMSLNIVSVSVSHSCPFCCAVGKPLPRPVPWEAPSQQRGRSGR